MTANVASVCTSFKNELMLGFHCLGAGIRAADALKAALYLQNQSKGGGTTAYSATGEVSGTGYTAGGKAVTNGVAPTTSGITAFWTPSAQVQWTGLTIASLFDCWLLYNSTQANRGIAVLTFPAQTVTAGTFTITFPANGPTTALLQVS